VTDPIEVQTQLKNALRRLAKAVVVVSCCHEGRRYAMSATAVSEVSIDPPSMLVCIARTASIHAPLAAGVDFCLNILHGSHEEISALCSGKAKGEERFATGEWRTSEEGIPFLADAQANVLCQSGVSLATKSHSIFIGKVVRAFQSGEVDPLVYVDGRYASVRAVTEA
jgi:flavin reductase (DIM6/NTAB) family NADH-FMN oxidoreductase RutF